MVENNYIENKNNIENNEFVLKTNVYYQKIFNERLNSFRDNLRNTADPMALLHIINPENIRKNIFDALNSLFMTIYEDNNRNYLNEHKLYLDAIYEELIFNSMDNFIYCYNAISEHVEQTNKNINDKMHDTSMLGDAFMGASFETTVRDYSENGKRSFSGILLSSAFSSIGSNLAKAKQLQNMKKATEMQQNLLTNISALIDEQILAEIDNIFARTLQMIPILSQAIYMNNLFFVFANHNELYDDEKAIQLKNEIINNPNEWHNWFNFAAYCNEKGKNKLALAIMNENIIYQQNSFEKWNLLALIYNNSQEFTLAEDSCNRMLEIIPNSTEALAGLYHIYMNTENYSKAFEVSEKLLNIKSDETLFLRYKAESLCSLGNVKEAQKIYEGILKNGNNDAEIIERINYMKELRNISTKNWYVTLLLSIFLPSFHRFYAGKIFTGILFIITFGGGFFWWIIDILFILSGKFKDGEGKYITIF